MPLEDIGAIEGLCRGRALAGAEAAGDGSLVVGSDEMPVSVIFAGEAALVELAAGDWALLGPLILMGEHVGLEVLE